MSKATTLNEKEIDEVHTLSAAVVAAVQSSTSPPVALNALLTAYINVALVAGMLDQVPGACAHLAEVSVQVLALQRQAMTEAAPAGAPIH